MLYNRNNDSGVTGEKWDGRALFHMRRHEVHLKIAEYSTKAFMNYSFLDEWCAQLMQLHRMLWGMLFRVKCKNDEDFNKSIQDRLIDIRKKIVASYQIKKTPNGQHIKMVNKVELSDVYLQLDQIQKEMAEIEYSKNLDLPKIGNRVENATSAGR